MWDFVAPMVCSVARTKQFKLLVLAMCEALAKNTDNDIDDMVVRHLRQLMFPERNETGSTPFPACTE